MAPAESFPVRECLLIVRNEEWHHRRFAERDLESLATEAGRGPAAGPQRNRSTRPTVA